MPPEELDLFQVLFLAVVQGLTEFLPVSSSGHLVLAGSWIGTTSPGLFLPILLHLGTLAAVLIVYRADVRGLIADLFAKRFGEIGLLIVATIPTVFVGLLLHSAIDEAFGDARAAACGLLFTAAVLWFSDSLRKRNLVSKQSGRTELTLRDAIVMGCAQAIAIMPGVSRSGSTIGAGMMLGIRPDRAARFSFLMSIPAILGATILEAKGLFGSSTSGASLGIPIAGMVVSALVGLIALRLLLAFLARGAFRWFAVYCALLGAGYLVFS